MDMFDFSDVDADGVVTPVALIAMPYSEVCVHMRVAGKVMAVKDVGNGMAQLYDEFGEKFSMPITWGEAGVRQLFDKSTVVPRMTNKELAERIVGDLNQLIDVRGNQPLIPALIEVLDFLDDANHLTRLIDSFGDECD
jgi:hypothetical protein